MKKSPKDKKEKLTALIFPGASDYEDAIALGKKSFKTLDLNFEMSDPNQPHSCAAWGNQFNDSDFEPTIVNGGSPYYDWWGMFETTYVPTFSFSSFRRHSVNFN